MASILLAADPFYLQAAAFASTEEQAPAVAVLEYGLSSLSLSGDWFWTGPFQAAAAANPKSNHRRPVCA